MLVGIETEYGIAVEGRGAQDLVAESIALVRSYRGPHVTGWNYRGEDPRRDMRGFTVDQLSTDPDDAQFDAPGAPRMSQAEERSDRTLGNGARLYNDHGHPEYATPECSSIRDLVAHDRAGERIVLECARARAATTGLDVRIYKNNVDYHGASYGTHECYLMSRDLPPDTLIQGMIPFLVTRQIYAGAGKAGEPNRGEAAFEISQRAGFFTTTASVDTLHNRPIVNTRDEPHATPRKYRRLHVIIGDANMSEWATAMKVGATSLVVRLLEDCWTPPTRLKNPVQALRNISKDRTLQWIAEREDGRSVYSIDIQREYWKEAKKRFAGTSLDTDWTLQEWDSVLTDLADDIVKCRDRVDWIAKRQLLEQFMGSESVNWGDPIIQSLDLAYHDVDPEAGLYYGLQESGEMRTLVTDGRIASAIGCPPDDTRAFIRGLFIQRFGQSIRSIGWNGIAFQHNGEDLLFDMNPLVEENVRLLNNELAAAAALDDVVRIIKKPAETAQQPSP